MCDVKGIPERNPEQLLAAELEKVGIYANPETLRLVLRDKWHRISTLAHAIHDAKPKEKTTREKVADWRTVDQLRAALAAVHDKVEKLERRMYGGGFY